uniref:Uncharacterized protein n=1 Tax=Ditylenchus dipsaci TaxID=166011 RepID=A0A915DNF2_9BILA
MTEELFRIGWDVTKIINHLQKRYLHFPLDHFNPILILLGCHKPAPYLDEFGETDPGFRPSPSPGCIDVLGWRTPVIPLFFGLLLLAVWPIHWRWNEGSSVGMQWHILCLFHYEASACVCICVFGWVDVLGHTIIFLATKHNMKK